MQTSTNRYWPKLPYEDWRDCCNTLQRWLQIVGKIRLSKTPWINHGWQSTLYVTPQGLTTSLIHDGPRVFSIDVDFVNHLLCIAASDGGRAQFALQSESVAAFHRRCFDALDALGIKAVIYEKPNELPDVTPFAEDEQHRTYDAELAHRFWQTLANVHGVMLDFRSKFLGKVSPIHFFWGAMDLAVTRFSGRRAPEHPGGVLHLPDLVTRDAYSHEVSSCGFWPGNDSQYPHAAFYSYAYPKPDGFEAAHALPEGAFWDDKMGEFILPYETVQSSRQADEILLQFFQSTYEAAANLGRWDRKLLEESAYLSKLQQSHGSA